MAEAADADVLLHVELVLREVLEDDREPRDERGAVPLAQVLAIEEDAPLRRLVEAREELDDRRQVHDDVLQPVQDEDVAKTQRSIHHGLDRQQVRRDKCQ